MGSVSAKGCELRATALTSRRHPADMRTVGRLAAVAAIAATACSSTAGAQTLDRRVRIVNESQHAIIGFYAVVVEDREWPPSLLGDATLPAGASVVLNFEDGSGYCRYRFRAIFDDGMELLRPSVNVCEVGTYRYTD